MSDEWIRATFEGAGAAKTGFSAESVVAVGYDGDGAYAFVGGHITPSGIAQIMKAAVDQFVEIMDRMGMDEDEARGQVMIAALLPAGDSETVTDIDTAARDEILRIAREMGVDADL